MSSAHSQSGFRIESDIKMESRDEFTHMLALDGDKKKIKWFSGLDTTTLDVNIFSSISFSQTNGVIKSFCKNNTISGYSSVLPWSLKGYQLADIYGVSTLCGSTVLGTEGDWVTRDTRSWPAVSNSSSSYQCSSSHGKAISHLYLFSPPRRQC